MCGIHRGTRGAGWGCPGHPNVTAIPIRGQSKGFSMSLTSRAELRGNKKGKQPLKSPASPTCPLRQASQVKPSLSNCFFGGKKYKKKSVLFLSVPSRHKASLPSPAGSFPERPGSPAGAGGHGQGVAQLHEEKDPAPGPAVAAGRPAPRAEAEGAAKRPETRRSSLQGGCWRGDGDTERSAPVVSEAGLCSCGFWSFSSSRIGLDGLLGSLPTPNIL